MLKSPALRAMIEKERKEIQIADGVQRIFWNADLDRMNRVAIKNARGHVYFEFGEPMLQTEARVWTRPLESMTDTQRAEFEGLADAASQETLPEVGSRMVTRLLTGQDMLGAWVIVQEGRYRYSVRQVERGVQVRSVVAEYLAIEVTWDC
jgi:hypothetical protein